MVLVGIQSAGVLRSGARAYCPDHGLFRLERSIEKAQDDVEHGRTVTHEEAKKQVMQWLESSGQIRG